MMWFLECMRGVLQNLKIIWLGSVLVAASATEANADFLDDLFGGSAPVPHATAPSVVVKRHNATAAKERVPRQVVRMKSEINFMPVARVKERQDHRERHFTTVAKGDEGASSAGSKPIVAALCANEETIAGASAPLLLAYDKTLRNGDILVMESGIQVFRGHSACPHDARDFIAISAVNMPRSKRSQLVAIEDAMHRPSGYSATAEIKER